MFNEPSLTLDEAIVIGARCMKPFCIVFKQLWQLEGYLLRERLSQSGE